MNNNEENLPWWAWVLLGSILLAQGTWLFLDARKRNKYPWFWGVWGFINTPLPLVLYICFVIRPWRKSGSK